MNGFGRLRMSGIHTHGLTASVSYTSLLSEYLENKFVHLRDGELLTFTKSSTVVLMLVFYQWERSFRFTSFSRIVSLFVFLCISNQ